MQSDQPSAHTLETIPVPRRIVVFVDRGFVPWVACDDSGLEILIVDGNMANLDVTTLCRRAEPIRLAAIDPHWRTPIDAFLGEPLVAPGSDDVPGETHTLPEGLTCRDCGSTEWRIIESIATGFTAGERTTRHLGTSDRWIVCASCDRAPENEDIVEEAYLAIDSQMPLMEAAGKVIQAWEEGDLAGRVRALAAALDALGYSGYAPERQQLKSSSPDLSADPWPLSLRELVQHVKVLYGVTKLISFNGDMLVALYVIAIRHGVPTELAITAAVAELLGLPYHDDRGTLQVHPQEGGVTRWLASRINEALEMPGQLRGADL